MQKYIAKMVSYVQATLTITKRCILLAHVAPQRDPRIPRHISWPPVNYRTYGSCRIYETLVQFNLQNAWTSEIFLRQQASTKRGTKSQATTSLPVRHGVIR